MIIIDSREKYPLFEFTEAIHRKLDYGDYTSEILEGFLRIERKASAGEFYHNLAGKKEHDRFHRELEQLSKFPYSIIVAEFPEQDLYSFPKNSGIPSNRWKYLRVGASYLRKLIYEIKDLYDIDIIFTDSREDAEIFIFNLIQKLESQHEKTQNT